MSARPWTWLAAAVGVAAAVLATWPLAARLRHSIPTPIENCSYDRCADHLLCVWILGEGGQRLYSDPLHVFEANIFHPFRHTLAYSESMLSAGALAAPVNAITGNPILGYNLYYLATYALSALGVALLVREITGEAGAGLLAGWMFALTAERWTFRGLLPAVAVQWAPFVLYTWVRLLTAPSGARAAALAAAFVAHTHASAYHGVMLPVLLVPWALVLVIAGPWPLRHWLAAGAVAAAAVVASLALYLPYLAVREELQYEPPLLGAALSMQYWGPFAHPLTYAGRVLAGDHRADFFASPLPLLLLAAAALAALVRRPLAPAPRGERAHLAAALVFMLAALAVALGPRIYVGRLIKGVPGPLFYLRQLPAFASMRAPMRFTVLASLGGAILGGIGVAMLLRRIRGRVAASALLVALAALVVVDTRTLRERMPLTRLPSAGDSPVYRWLATTPADTAVIELPYGGWGDEATYMLHSLFHRRRLFNGYSAVMPRFGDVLGGFPDDTSLRMLADTGVRYAIVHAAHYRATRPGQAQLARMEARRDLAPRWIADDLVLDIPAGGAPAAPRGRPLDPRGWRVEGSEPGAELVADGDLATHWTAHADKQDGFLRVDLGSEALVTGIDLGLGPHFLEYPRQYEILASRDEESWERIGGERPTLPPMASYRRDHRAVVLSLALQPTRARHIEIRVPKYPQWAWTYTRGVWGVHELTVYAEAPG